MKLIITLFAMLLLVANAEAQTRTVTGKITDQNGVAVPNATVLVKNSKTGVASNANGEFAIQVPQASNILVISSVNYETQEANVSSSDNITVALKQTSGNLSEVIVVAYGAQKKTNVTGAVATIKGSDIADKPFTSIDKALQGLTAGVQSTSASGAPGSATNIRIRGIGSINASAAPLWVIDGVIATIGDLTSNTTTANALSGLNPDDIESMTVLKDAAATSIYGSRAANGVIIVTTKKGKAGKTILSLVAEAGANDIAYRNNDNKSLTSLQVQTLLREGLINAGLPDADAADKYIQSLGIPKNYTKTNTDWYKEVTRTANQSQYNLSLTGGNEKTQFYTSAGLFNQEGTVIASDFKRYNGGFSLTHKPNSKITFTTGMNGSYSRQHTPTNTGNFSNPVIASYFLLPWYTPCNKDGSLRYGDNDPDGEFPANGGPYNPLAIAALDKGTAKQINFRGYVSGEYSIIPDLKFTSRYSGEFLTIQEDSYNNPIYGDGQSYGGLGIGSNRRVFDWTWSNLLDYKHGLNKDGDFYFDILGGLESQYYNKLYTNKYGAGFSG